MEIKTKERTFATIDNLATAIVRLMNQNADSDDEYNIDVIGHYEEIKDLLECLIHKGCHIGCILDLQSFDIECYSREFDLMISEGSEVSVERDWHDGNEYHDEGYFLCDGDVVFVFDDCNSALLKEVYSKHIYTVSIGEEESEPEKQEPKKESEQDKKETSESEKDSESIEKDVIQLLEEALELFREENDFISKHRPFDLFDWIDHNPFRF